MLRMAIVGAIVAAIIAGGTWLYMQGKNAARVEQLESSVEAYKKREDIDNVTETLSDVDICIRLGGLQSDCEQLRGVEETTESE